MNNRIFIDSISGKVKSNRHARFLRQREKDIRAIDEVSRNYVSGIVWSDSYSEYILPDAVSYRRECGKVIPAKKAYPKRYYRCKASLYYKKSCNRRFRRQKRDFFRKSNTYRRCTEFWWELY